MEHILFLRGINTGGKTVKMADLRNLLTKAGYTGVQTLLQTGNIILDSQKDVAAIIAKVESLIQGHYHFEVKAVHRTADQLRMELEKQNKPDSGNSRHQYLILLNEPKAQAVTSGAQTDPQLEKVSAGEKVVFWEVEKGHTLDTPFAKHLNKISRTLVVTTRNVNTLAKLLAACKA